MIRNFLKFYFEEKSTFLYHATYWPLLKSIKKFGLDSSKSKKMWEDSKDGVIYLATNPDEAIDFAESSDEAPDKWIDNIVVLKIDASKLDKNKLKKDSNVRNDDDTNLEYHGIIPFDLITIMK